MIQKLESLWNDNYVTRTAFEKKILLCNSETYQTNYHCYMSIPCLTHDIPPPRDSTKSVHFDENMSIRKNT